MSAENGLPGNTVQPFAFGNGHEHDDDCDHEDRCQTLVDLPAPVRGRVAALRKLQIDTLSTEAEFYKAVHKLEQEFAVRFNKLNQQRADIINEVVEPTAEEAKFPLFSDAETDLSTKFTGMLAAAQPNSADNSVKGIPDFWLTVLNNVHITQEMIQESDAEALKQLKDITVELTNEPMGFKLNFHFKENDYFTNAVLTKVYTMKCEPDMNDPADFDGPEIVNTKCLTPIEWKEGKNLTIKLVKKKQKNKKQAGQTRFVTKQVKADSFFNFFDPPAHTGGVEDEDMAEDDRMMLHCDFEIGQTIRDTVVPHALFHFTGEADDMDDEDFDDDDDDESDDGSDADDDE